jgi:diguanylate cyclase (GGDEF)-like protein
VLRRKNREYRQVHRLYLDQSKRSMTDALTQLCNRRKLDEELRMAFDHFQIMGRPFALVMLDIDHFKDINDRFGHQTGDRVLRHIAELLSNNCRSLDVIGRWGGEEFMLICQGSDAEGAYQLAEKLRQKVAQYSVESEYAISASFGVGEPVAELTLTQFLRQVDLALYEAKRKGRNRTELAQPPEGK